jgi:colanic acid/amylovoran biosynthesis glycosyltransferase
MPVLDETNVVQSVPARKLAYLLSIYPAVSHTFFLNEICELRKLGLAIEVASINTPDQAPEGVTVREAEELKSTFYVKAVKRTNILRLLAKLIFTRPAVVLRGLRGALSLDPWDFRASAYALFYLVEALLVGDWMNRRGHDHLHVHFGGSVATVAMLVTTAWGIPYSIMIHGPDEFYDVSQTHLRAKVEQAQFVFCISDYCHSQVMKIAAPSHWDKLHVLRLGVDPAVFVPCRLLRNDSLIEIICVGRLVPAKGQLILLRAVFHLLLKGYPLRLRFVGDGADRPRLEEFIEEHRLGDSVVLEGARNHESTRLLLGQADIFALPSFAEGLPVALMEAMAMEVPCVSTYVAAIPELIRDGLDGLLVPPSSHEGLMAALERLIVDPELRCKLARSGRLRVVELYNLEQNMRSLAAVFENQLPKLV